MTTRRLLIVSVHFFMTLDLCQPYYFIDEECMSRYNCTLKPRLPCHVKVLSECPPPTHLVHWPTKPTDVTVTEYDSVFGLRKRQCYGRENITWGIPNDGSMERLKGFTLTITCLHGHCFGRKECVYFNLSKAVWDIGDIVSKVTYSFDCLRPLRGTHHIDLATLPKAHDGSNSYATTVTLPLKDCRPPSTAAPTTPSTPRPTSSTGSITTSGTGDTSTARQRPTTTSDSLTTTSDISTKTSFVSATTYVVASTPLTSGERTPTPAESKEETRSRQNPGVFTAVTIALGCFCGFLLSTLLLFFIYKRYRMTGKSHQNSSTVENEANNVTYNSARDAVTIGGRENGYTVPHSMSTLETMLSVNTERFWDVGPFKPPELVDTDTRSMTTSELNRAVRAINAEDAEQQQHRANSSGCMSDFRPLVAVFSRIDESEETCSISGTSI